MTNFKLEQVNAFSREQVEAVAKPFFTIYKDATQEWKKQGQPVVGTPEFKEFAKGYCKSKLKNAENLGAIVTIKKGQPSTRENPFKIENVKNEQGPRKYETVYEGFEVGTDRKLFTVAGKKEDARKEIAKLYETDEKGNCSFTGDVEVFYKRVVKEGEPLAMKASYTPSKNTNEGIYVIFGHTIQQ